ncbi:uncharacterized protein LOC125025074 [Penaeus chinensis]|uniref:uncharacterized protein LOC125025074 n=1 Tax=Penaeus chinensis TaxID=139456 RepID=UPI001FB7EE29|nr:uncharacterized protein LOC125025074 [Penaeus chinensis]
MQYHDVNYLRLIFPASVILPARDHPRAALSQPCLRRERCAGLRQPTWRVLVATVRPPSVCSHTVTPSLSKGLSARGRGALLPSPGHREGSAAHGKARNGHYGRLAGLGFACVPCTLEPPGCCSAQDSTCVWTV